ncbi:MAG: glycolate oxidase subunit GlcE [Burkholderiales bacterium]|nr:glycolate oxidase subunit GlcE [Burkholderiales bacterium]
MSSDPHHLLSLFREQIQAASAAQTPLQIRGGGTKSWYGAPCEGEVLACSGYAGVVAYEPSELVLTARCGTRLSEIETMLAQQGQMLAFEPPHFGEEATLGGMVAAGLSGPRRASAGAVRDFVLGVQVMNGRGEILRFGGQTMKNVAGYDVSRLMAGSMGALGVLLEVSLKVLPLPQLETSLAFSLDECDALRYLNQWGGLALPISASAFHAGRLMVRLSGSESALRLARHKMGGQEVGGCAEFWRSVREQRHHFFQAEQGLSLLRFSLPSNAPSLPVRSKSLIEWGGAQRWIWTQEPLPQLREWAQKVGGHVTQFRYADIAQPVWMPLPPAMLKIHQQLKRVFDPACIFNRDRLFSNV